MNFPNNQKINRILIIRLSSMGDVILTTALVRLLRNKFPNAVIDFVTSNKFSEVLLHNPNISNLIEYDKKWTFGQIKSHKKKNI
jgi:heptosyltransferase III